MDTPPPTKKMAKWYSKEDGKQLSTPSLLGSLPPIKIKQEASTDALKFDEESSRSGKWDSVQTSFVSSASIKQEGPSSSTGMGMGGTSVDDGIPECSNGNSDVDMADSYNIGRQSKSPGSPDITTPTTGVPGGIKRKFFIEKIVNYRVTVERGRAMERFEAKWYNWPPESNTWEPHAHVDNCHDLIVAFFEVNPRKYQLYLQYGDTVKATNPRILMPGQDSKPSEAELKPETITKELPSKRKMIDNRDHLYDENSSKYIPVALESEIEDQRVKRIQGHYRSPEITAYLVRLCGLQVHKSIWVKDIDTEELSGFYHSLKRYHNLLVEELCPKTK